MEALGRGKGRGQEFGRSWQSLGGRDHLAGDLYSGLAFNNFVGVVGAEVVEKKNSKLKINIMSFPPRTTIRGRDDNLKNNSPKASYFIYSSLSSTKECVNYALLTKLFFCAIIQQIKTGFSLSRE